MANPSLSEKLAQKLPQAVIATHSFRGDETVTIRPEHLLSVAGLLKSDPEFQMNFLIDLTAVDYLTFGKQPSARGAHNPAGIAMAPPTLADQPTPWPGLATAARFEVVIHFFSLVLKERIRIKVPVEEANPEIDSLTPLWPAANWFEREVWDMVGIRFRGHPNLKRILMYAEFEGHPLRKDYPVNQRQPLIGPVI